MNFGTILDSITKNCISMMLENKTRESKVLASSFMDYVKLKDPLRKQFEVYVKLGSSYCKNQDVAKIYVSEVLSSINGISYNNILTYNNLLETRFSIPKIKSTDLNNHISNLIKYKTSTDKDELSYVNSLSEVISNLMILNKNEINLGTLNEELSNSSLKFLKPKHILRIAVNSFNKEFSTMTESDKKVFFTLKDGSKNDKTKMHSIIINKIDNIISNYDSKIFEGDGDLIDKTKMALTEVRSEATQDNILNAHELLSELERLLEWKTNE